MTVIPLKLPYCNTGAQRTEENGLRACVDWVQVTLKIVTPEQLILDILGLNPEEFYEAENGQYGYRRAKRFGNIAVFYDGREDMGIHLQISGQGCREYESLERKTWKQLFYDLVCYKAQFTRLDVAVDDFEGYFKISSLIRKIKGQELISKFKTATRIEKIDIESGESKGNTIYYGSESSRIQIRMYEKDKEREGKGHELEKDLKCWNRTEIQARNERAQKIAELILLNEEGSEVIGEIVTGILKNYLRFVVKDKKDSNRRRWKTAPFWDKFLGNVEKLRLTNISPDRTVQRTYDWIDKQVAPSLAVLFHAFEGDMDVLKRFILEGSERLTEKEHDMIKRYKDEQKNSLFSA